MSNYYVPELDLPEHYKIAAMDGGYSGYTYTVLHDDKVVDGGFIKLTDAVECAWYRDRPREDNV